MTEIYTESCKIINKGIILTSKCRNVVLIHSDVVLPDGELIRRCAKYAASSSMCDFSDKDIKLYKVVVCVCVVWYPKLQESHCYMTLWENF